MNKELRAFSIAEFRQEGDELIVSGMPVVFNSPTVMYEIDGIQYKEIIDARAFDSADLSDVIMNYNHGGKVVARLRNKTLNMNIGTNGVDITAYLGGTQEGRNLYEEIKGGYIDKMSFAFTVADEEYDQPTHTRVIKKIKKLYDVAAVDIPAYEQTNISARNYFSLEHEKEVRALEQARLKELIIAKTKL